MIEHWMESEGPRDQRPKASSYLLVLEAWWRKLQRMASIGDLASAGDEGRPVSFIGPWVGLHLHVGPRPWWGPASYSHICPTFSFERYSDSFTILQLWLQTRNFTAPPWNAIIINWCMRSCITQHQHHLQQLKPIHDVMETHVIITLIGPNKSIDLNSLIHS